MYQFFYCLYLALFKGTWSATEDPQLANYMESTFKLIFNSLGGNFTSPSYINFFSGNMSAYGLCANILAIITMFGVCFGVLKLTKMVFSIFFGGR